MSTKKCRSSYSPASTTPSTVAGSASERADPSFRDWLIDRKNRRQIPHRLEAADYVQIRNEAAKDGMWVVKKKRQVIYGRRDLSLRDRIVAAQKLAGGSP